ncbi:MAG: LysM peptidoglycan-binding domain-containing protein [Verrucomicrobiota bacterium]
MKKIDPDHSPFDIELESYWQIKMRQFREWVGSNSARAPRRQQAVVKDLIPPTQAVDREKTERVQIPREAAEEPQPRTQEQPQENTERVTAAAPISDEPGSGMPLPLVVLGTALITVIGTVFILGGFNERGRTESSSNANAKWQKQLDEQRASYEAQLTQVRSNSSSLEEKVKNFGTERAAMQAEIDKLKEDRNRLVLGQEQARIERNVAVSEALTEPEQQPVDSSDDPIRAQPILRVAPNPNGPLQAYIIRDGDTLTQISNRSGVTVQEILKLNSLSSANHINVGQRLLLPASANMKALERYKPEIVEPTPSRSSSTPSNPRTINAPRAIRFVQDR